MSGPDPADRPGGLRRGVALTAWEVERLLRAGQTRVAGSALVGWLLLTAAGDRAGVLVSGHDRGFAAAYLLAFSLGAGLGLAEDRRLGLERLLVVDLVSPAVYLLSKTAALAILLVGAGVVSFLLLALLTGGAWGLAAWEAVAFTLFALALLPVLALVETGLDTRFPAFVVMLALLLGALVLMMSGGPLREVVAALGLDVRPGEWATLRPLSVRVAVALLLGPLVVLPAVRLRLPSDHTARGPAGPEHPAGGRV